MSTPTPSTKLAVASVTDRGLSEKRPLNEDSFLADAERGIFSVADGVGGAEAGEVASQTAIEVLDAAFQHRLGDGDDAEDLMELAIQRANSSIHQMAAEHPKFSMMATTIVALHVDGLRASFAHVGDSRLYRLSPEGKLSRETEDHSVVEEEVRAGRMTPEQAANHPSKNVISRALGAESSVEVDTKTTDVQEGTTFLLCTDGITRHLPDNELRDLLLAGPSADAICAEMKQRCYQRGAEDNLTAVIVQVGAPKYSATPIVDETQSEARTRSLPDPPLPVPVTPETRLTPPSRIAIPGPTTSQPPVSVAAKAVQSSSGGGRPVLRFLVFLLFVVSVAGAFYGGMRYQQSHPDALNLLATSQPSPAPSEDPGVGFQRKRAAVDSDPRKWIADFTPLELAKEGITKPIDSKDPEFLYLYGRALMLSGNHREAVQAFERAVTNLRSDPKVALPLGTEVKLAEAAAALKLINPSPGRSQESSMAEQKVEHVLDEMLGLNSKEPAK